jgi:phosphonate transport system ATP-binding protein
VCANEETVHPLEVRDLAVVFGGGVRALDGVSLSVGVRDFLVVLGPSGAGKSTLLRCLNRLHTPTSGQVLYKGQDVTHASGRALRRLRQNVGMIFQQFNLVGRLSVLENVMVGRLAQGLGPIWWTLAHAHVFAHRERDIAMESLRTVGIEHLAEQRADTLSGGQQQRVAIARLLSQRPQAILADEPIASLDPRSAEQVLDALHRIHDMHQIPVVVNLHQVEIARRHASRIVGMNQGRIVFDGEPGRLDGRAVESLYAGAAATPLDDDGADEPAALVPGEVQT